MDMSEHAGIMMTAVMKISKKNMYSIRLYLITSIQYEGAGQVYFYSIKYWRKNIRAFVKLHRSWHFHSLYYFMEFTLLHLHRRLRYIYYYR